MKKIFRKGYTSVILETLTQLQKSRWLYNAHFKHLILGLGDSRGEKAVCVLKETLEGKHEIIQNLFIYFF